MPLTQQPRKLRIENLTLSGTEYIVNNIPAWANDIDITINGLSTNTANEGALRIGTGGIASSTGYEGMHLNVSNSSAVAGSAFRTNSLSLNRVVNAADTQNQLINLKKISGNKWLMHSFTFVNGSTDYIGFAQSYKELTGVLDCISFYINGTDIFDAGNITIEVNG